MKIFFKNIFLLALVVFMINNCSNTRVIIQGVKTVINNDKSEKIEKKNKPNVTTGHYKIGKPYIIKNVKYTPKLVSTYNKNGIASWYGPKFDKKLTANGEIFDQNKISAAHKTLPLPSIVKVTNLTNNKFLFIRVNDRGPFVNDRIIDLSKQAAIELNIFSKGIEDVNVKLIESGPHLLEVKFLDQKYLEKYANNLESNNTNEYSKLKKNNFLQLGVFSIKENALKYIKDIKENTKNYNLEFFLSEYNENNVFKVLIGPFESIENAKNIADNLLELGYNSIIITNKDHL